MTMKRLYTYRGPVMVHERIFMHNWFANTYAVSPAQAESNIKFQAKRALGLVPYVPVTLCKEVVAGPQPVRTH